MSFETLGLTPDLIRVVADQGYTIPTPVQEQAIPLVLARRDVLAGAQTGTGKTAAFVLPILQILHATRPEPRQLPIGNGRPRGATGLPIRCLVLAPTRELALQVEESVRTYGARRPIRSTTIYGGVGFDPQVRALRSGPEIVVATPGRLLDHVMQRTIDLSTVEILVLDEADRMLDMGFIRDIRKIIGLLPPRRQNLLFSATFSDEIRSLAAGILQDPAFVQVARRNEASSLVTQLVHPVDRERKRELLSHLIRSGRIDQALVFTRTKHGANRLAEQLTIDGISAAPIHGNRSQGQRVRALDDFKNGRVAILVATELAARGLDIEGLPHVVNYELPMTPEDYVHRIGRTGRAGVDGEAISLVCVDEGRLLRDIEGVLGHRIPSEVVAGFEPNPAIRPEAIKLRTGVGQAVGAGRGGGAGRPGTSGRAGGNRPSAYGTRPPAGDRAGASGGFPASGSFAGNGAFGASGGDRGPGSRPQAGQVGQSNSSGYGPNGGAYAAGAGSRDGRDHRDGFAGSRRPGHGPRPSQPHRSVQSSVPGQGIGRPAPAGRSATGGRPGGRPANRADARPSNHRAPHPPRPSEFSGPVQPSRPQPDPGRAARRMDLADQERAERLFKQLPGERISRSNRP